MSPLSKKMALSVCFKNPRTSLDKKRDQVSYSIINGSSNLVHNIKPFLKTAHKCKKEPLKLLQVSIKVCYIHYQIFYNISLEDVG